MSRKKKGQPARLLATWHQRAGVAAALLVIIMAFSGIMLNHGEAIGLDRKHVNSGMLLALYGISPPQGMRSYPTGNSWVTQVEDKLYYGVRQVAGRHARLAGAVALDGEIVVVLADGILMLDGNGGLAEERPVPQLSGGPVTAVGVWQGRLALATHRQAYVASRDLTRWDSISRSRAEWTTEVATPATLEMDIGRHFSGSILSYERVMLDVHSGRILGKWGVLLMDVAAITLLLLALSGGWLWLQRRSQPGDRERKG